MRPQVQQKILVSAGRGSPERTSALPNSTMIPYIAYYRVSTSKQGASGLGLEAQKQIVDAYIGQEQGRRVLMSFQDIESGKKNTRPQLMKAIEACRKFNCTLLIAKLDRLSRNASFILTLRDNNVKFQALDIPEANTLTIGIFCNHCTA